MVWYLLIVNVSFVTNLIFFKNMNQSFHHFRAESEVIRFNSHILWQSIFNYSFKTWHEMYLFHEALPSALKWLVPTTLNLNQLTHWFIIVPVQFLCLKLFSTSFSIWNIISFTAFFITCHLICFAYVTCVLSIFPHKNDSLPRGRTMTISSTPVIPVLSKVTAIL